MSRGRVSTDQTFFTSEGLLPPLFPNHSVIFSRVFPLRIIPYVSPESLEQATFILSCSANLSDISFPCVNMSYFVFIGIDLVLKGRLKLREKGTKQISYERCVCVNRLKCFIRIEMMITHRTDWGQNPPVSNLAGTSLQIKK